jgi:Leucine Rich repeat
MSAGPVSCHWRRFLRFSVRGLIVLVLVTGVSVGWLVRSARIQREAVATIERAGGRVRYDSEWSTGKSIPAGKPWAPRWLTDLIGVDYFGRVTTVRLFSSSRASDATLAHVGRLTRLQRLNLDQSAVSDSGLAHLKGLTNLTFLALGGTQVTDAGLAQLKGLTRLSSLDLTGTHVTDAGLVYLKGLTSLRNLEIGGTQVKDAGVKELTRVLPSLRITR